MHHRNLADAIEPGKRLLVTTEALQVLTDCGRDAATKIGTEAGARVKVGKRVLWNVEKIRKYLETVSS